MHIHPLLPLLLPLTTATASPSPPILPATSPALSLVPYHTLFYRQLSDLQTFTAALGGVRASSITNSGIPDRPFEVGGDNFPDFESAAQRSCDRQFQGCQEMANSNGNGNGGGGDGDGGGKGKGKGFTVGMCGEQKSKCNQAQQTAKVQDFQSGVASTNIGPDPLFPDFDLICEG